MLHMREFAEILGMEHLFEHLKKRLALEGMAFCDHKSVGHWQPEALD